MIQLLLELFSQTHTINRGSQPGAKFGNIRVILGTIGIIIVIVGIILGVYSNRKKT